ncbi:MAG: YceI family protein [Gammaproteobacteria bacterium]|nr:YceI family protein [Gammaproteobacteria bacterium]
MTTWKSPLAATLVAFATALAPCMAAPARQFSAVAADSHLDFTGTQAGAPFTAEFRRFRAAIVFSPDDLPHSRFDVVIDLASVDSKDHDRDTTIRGSDLFDVARWPTAHYVTSGFTRTAGGFAATGMLTLRGVSRPVPITFRFLTTQGGATLTGSAKLERLDFGVGQGDWKSTEWVGNDVRIDFSLVLVPQH